MYLFRPGKYNLSLPVLAVQMNVSGRVELPEDGAVSLAFDIPQVTINIYDILHTVYDIPICIQCEFQFIIILVRRSRP